MFALTATWLAATALPMDEVAVWTSERVASEPEVSPAPVSVREAAAHTSVVRVPNPVKVRVPAAHTLVGRDAIEEVIDVRDMPSEVDAARTELFVLALMTEASDELAVPTVFWVFAFTIAAIELEAVSILEVIAA